MRALAYQHSQSKDYSAYFPFAFGNGRMASMRHISIPRIESHAAVMAARLKEQRGKERQMKMQSCSFCSESTTVLKWIYSSHRKQQLFFWPIELLSHWMQLTFDSGRM